MERNNVITTLEVLKANCSKHSRDYQALDYAISSLKTDEAYQIMYEGEEIYTKDDIVAMLTDIQLEIEELYPNTELNTYYRAVDDCSNLIQQKIDALKENTDDNC